MKSRSPRSRALPKLPGFPGAILEFLEEFNVENGVDDPLVKVTLVSGESLYFRGLRVDPSTIVTGCIFMRWSTVPSIGALVIGEDRIARVEFEVLPPDPPSKPPLGFQA